MNNRGKLIVISGPSGAGKSTVIGKVLDSVDNASSDERPSSIISASLTSLRYSPASASFRHQP